MALLLIKLVESFASLSTQLQVSIDALLSTSQPWHLHLTSLMCTQLPFVFDSCLGSSL